MRFILTTVCDQQFLGSTVEAGFNNTVGRKGQALEFMTRLECSSQGKLL